MSVVTVSLLSNGKAINLAYQLLSVRVSHEVNRIPYAKLVFIDGDVAKQKFTISNSEFFEPGKEIEIKLRYEHSVASEKTVFKGLIVSQEVSVENDQSTLAVLLKDRAIVLTQGMKYRVFNKMSDAEIIKKIISSNKLAVGKIDDTKPQYSEMTQYDCNDWDFIQKRAESNGLLINVQDSKVSAVLIKAPGHHKASINYGIDQIYDFNIEVNGLDQFDKVSATAWNAQNQQEIVVDKSKNFNLTPGNLKSKQLAQKLGGNEYALATSAQLSQAELNAWIFSKLTTTQLNLIRGRIALSGRTDISVLDSIEIKGISDRFNGLAVVTGISHRVSQGSWITDIQLGLTHPLYPITKPAASGLLPTISGLQTGLVISVDEDQSHELKVQVKLPMLSENANSLWARLVTPDAGKNHGFYFRPEINDEVVIGFVNDDPRQAIILGALFSSKNSIPSRFSKPSDQNKGISSKKGMLIGFDDKKNLVYLETPSKNSISLDEGNQKIEIKDQHGNIILMDKNGITIKSVKDLKLEASGDVSIKGSKVDIK